MCSNKTAKNNKQLSCSLGHSGDSKKYKIINHRYQFAYIIAQVRALVRGKKNTRHRRASRDSSAIPATWNDVLGGES